MGNNGKVNIKDLLLTVVFIILLAIPGYLSYKLILPLEMNNIKGEEDTSEEEITEEENIVEEIPVEKENKPEEEAYIGPHYEETFETIDTQVAYIATPTNIDEFNPPSVVIYSHGSNTRVTEDTEDPFIQDLMLYGERYTTDNFIFAASNEHGENWGNEESVEDIQNLIDWIKDRYPTTGDIYMIGFSMGGLPTAHYFTQYPANIERVALLAPTTRTYEWTSSIIEKVEDIEIKIWHGVDDVNIGIVYTDEFVNHLKNLGKDVELVRLAGKSHFDLDTEYMEEVLKFFEEN